MWCMIMVFVRGVDYCVGPVFSKPIGVTKNVDKITKREIDVVYDFVGHCPLFPRKRQKCTWFISNTVDAKKCNINVIMTSALPDGTPGINDIARYHGIHYDTLGGVETDGEPWKEEGCCKLTPAERNKDHYKKYCEGVKCPSQTGGVRSRSRSGSKTRGRTVQSTKTRTASRSRSKVRKASTTRKPAAHSRSKSRKPAAKRSVSKSRKPVLKRAASKTRKAPASKTRKRATKKT